MTHKDIRKFKYDSKYVKKTNRGELHENYGGKAKMAPELKLLFML